MPFIIFCGNIAFFGGVIKGVIDKDPWYIILTVSCIIAIFIKGCLIIIISSVYFLLENSYIIPYLPIAICIIWVVTYKFINQKNQDESKENVI
jgi:hypothetical protein